MKDETSIQRQLQRYRSLVPSCCPNPSCKFHLLKHQPFWHRFGSYKLDRFPYLAPRFRCKECDRTFSVSIFELHYRQQVWGHNQKILEDFLDGISKRAIARRIKRSENLVRLRLIKMARWGILKHQELSQNLKIQEPIVYDGLENFAFSQYDPNNINHAVGKNSLFTYDFNLCSFNRKGRMSARQEGRLKAIQQEFGKYPKNTIRVSTRNLLSRLVLASPAELCLYSDRHFQYRRAIAEIRTPIRHIMVSSKIARNFKNHLFAVNNIDMQARQNLAAFKRETISFAKHTVGMLETFTLYVLHRNYMRPKFWKKHRADPLTNKKSPAMYLGITNKILSFDDFFKERTFPAQVRLNPDWQGFYERRDPYSRQKIAQRATI
jgi:transposase-like protein